MTATDRDLLARVIDASGLSARRFATTVLFRNERTVRRWLAGENDMPVEVLAFLNAQAESVAAPRSATPTRTGAR